MVEVNELVEIDELVVKAEAQGTTVPDHILIICLAYSSLMSGTPLEVE